MKRWILLLIICMLLITTIGMSEALEEKTILNKWVRYDHTFTYDNQDYRINTLETGDKNHPEDGKIAIRGPNNTVILNYGECKETKEYKYCFENVTFEGEYIDIDEKGQNQPGLKLNLIKYNYEIDLEVKRMFEDTKFKLFDINEVAISITNTGDQILNNVMITEPVPKGFEITSHSNNVQKVNEQIIAGPITLYPKTSWSGKYKIKANDYVEETYSTNISYTTEDGQEKNQQGPNKRLTVEKPFELKVGEIKENYDLGEEVEFKLNLENFDDEKLNIIEFEISTPSNFQVVSSSGMSKKNNKFYYEGSLREDEKREFNIDMKSTYTGRYSISYFLKFELKGQEYIFSDRIPFGVNTEGVSCYFTIEDENLKAGNTFIFDANIENNDDQNYYEFIGTIENPLGEQIKINKTNIDKDRAYFIESEKIILPITDQDKEYELKMNVEYRSAEKEYFECESILPITIKGSEMFIEAKLDAPDQSIAIPGEDYPIKIILENLVDKEFNDVYVEHEVTNNLTTSGYSRKKIENLEGKETIEAYDSTIKIPEDYKEDYFKVLLTVGAANPKYETSISVEIPVKQNLTQEEKEEIIKTKEENKKTTETTINDENSKNTAKELSFVDKAIKFFKDLFKGNK